jgi:hypothetical protein
MVTFPRVISVLALVAGLVGITFAVAGYVKAENAIKQVVAEGAERRDQSCLHDEIDQRADVRGLRLTYKYIVKLTPRQRATPFNALLIQQLPRSEREAGRDDAPPFCDEPGFGLPEPDQPIPDRPAELIEPYVRPPVVAQPR